MVAAMTDQLKGARQAEADWHAGYAGGIQAAAACHPGRPRQTAYERDEHRNEHRGRGNSATADSKPIALLLFSDTRERRILQAAPACGGGTTRGV